MWITKSYGQGLHTIQWLICLIHKSNVIKRKEINEFIEFLESYPLAIDDKQWFVETYYMSLPIQMS